MGQNGSGFWAGERDGLVGRDETLTTLRELLDTGSRTAVVTGIPGAGKTSVLEVVARAEAADGRLVLPLTCHASERPLAFGMLVDLLMLAPGAESILESILPTTSRAFAVDALRLRLEVLAWLERLGEERPVVVRAVWMTGDTVLHRPVRRYADWLDVDVLLLHMGSVQFPITGPLRYSMNSADAAQLVRRTDPRVVVPVHYEGWSHFHEPEAHARAALPTATWLQRGVTTEV